MSQTSTKSKFPRSLIWIFGILGGLVLIFAVLTLFMLANMGAVPSDLDYSTTRLSEDGLFKVSYTAPNGTVPVNQMHQWTLYVETADGQPVESAAITVDGDMPQHGHGLPTRPQVTQDLGNGQYLVEGLRFQMGGWWVMDFAITAGNQTDIVHFNMNLR